MQPNSIDGGLTLASKISMSAKFLANKISMRTSVTNEPAGFVTDDKFRQFE